ncbi:MAG: hypothetical protein J1G01_03430 [Clostridiales bacterium]|nr:hypothetical protein [Clostridiales bacterium]
MFGSNIKIKATVSIVLSALFLGAVVFCYIDCLGKCVEMTFLSNVTIGLLLLCAGVKLLITNKDIPQFLYLDCAVLMASVMCACSIFAPEVCFVGSSVLLHIVTPVCMMSFFFLFCDATKCGKASIATSLVFPSLYYIFMIVYGRFADVSVYVYFDTNAVALFKLVLVGLSAVVMLGVIAAVLLFCNRFMISKFSRRAFAVIQTEKSNDK